MIPVYGFLQGDTLGLLILLQEDQTIRQVAEAVQSAASLRVAPLDDARVVYRGRTLDPRLTVGAAGIKPLERIDVCGGTAR